ncbi:MAG: hypothetical protein IBJ03_05970 [Gemmatimonadaceae bacterium]|nr:hypothetical protein [Gemmatimonadaceae bacterium]
MRYAPLALALLLAACENDRTMAALVAERAQLRREIAGLQDLRHVSDSGLVRHPDEIVLSVADSVMQAMLAASLPVTLVIPGRVTVTLTKAEVAFRGNVARVIVTGTARRTSFPLAAADLSVRGTIDEFEVDSTRSLHSRIRIDDAVLTEPTGVPNALGGLSLGILQRLVDRALPQIASALPEAILPVRFDHDLRLPGFGPEGALAVDPARAILTISASRVLAFQNRLTVVLKIERSPFMALDSTDSVKTDSARDDSIKTAKGAAR